MSNTEIKEDNTHILHDKLVVIKKYGVLGLAVVTFPFWQPYLDAYLDKGTEEAVARAVKSNLEPFCTQAARLQNAVIDMETLMINCKGGAKALKANDIDYIARKAVGMQSIIKVKEIKRLIQTYPRDTKHDKVRLRLKIKEVLIRNSMIYVNDLNAYQHRAIGRIGKYIWDEFPMDEFLVVVYSLTADSAPENKLIYMTDDLMAYMLDIQNTFFIDMLDKMLKYEKGKQ